MAEHIGGPLYYERTGHAGPILFLVPPHPMDQSGWMFQMAHMSTWCRCVAVDLPGYGRSPNAKAGLTLPDLAAACWEAVDDAFPHGPTILAGCSVGSAVAMQMYHLRPQDTAALVLSGTGFPRDDDEVSLTRRANRLRNYDREGVDYRWRFVFEDFSPAFRTTELAHYLAELFCERNELVDIESIKYQFDALAVPKPENFYSGIKCPTIILTGTEDKSHQRAFALRDLIPGCQLKTLPGAGHACQLEQPLLFDRFVIEFLQEAGLIGNTLSPHG